MSLATRLALVALGGALSIVALPRDADACSPPPCRNLFTLPVRADMPANTVAFRVSSQDVGEAKIVDDTGAPVETQVSPAPNDEGWLFRPKAALVPGKVYKLVYPNVCLGYGSGPTDADAGVVKPPMGELEIYPAPPRDYPTTSGKLVVRERAITDVSSDRPGIATRLAWEPSVDMQAFYAMAETAITIDGKPLVFYGSLATGDLINVPSMCSGGDWSPTTCGDYTGAPPGKHTIRVQPNIPGATTKPPAVELAIDVSCDPKSVLPSEMPTVVEQPDSRHSEATSEGGCSLSTQRAPGNAIAAFGLVIGALLLARARRSSGA